MSDAEPGLRRVRHGKTFSYVDAQGRPVTDEATLQRIRKLAIPPAYEDVWISTNPNGHLQATGRDARGRKQYRYHADWHAQRGQSKFTALAEFGQVLPRLRQRIERTLSQPGGPTRERVLATLARLLDTTWLRIGNEEYARENGSFGLSTLRRRHADVRGAEVRLSFVGKSGVRHEAHLTDKRVAGVLRRCRELPGQELFRYIDENGEPCRVGSSDVNAWLTEAAGRPTTAKQFRTWHGSVLALSLTLQACRKPEPCTPVQLITEVARRLGNTVSVCRKAYIHPGVLDLGESLAFPHMREALLEQPWVSPGAPRRGLSAHELRFLALLRASQKRRRPTSRALSKTPLK